jgi:alpha-beta hydrolase superfamily lysophospholipase
VGVGAPVKGLGGSRSTDGFLRASDGVELHYLRWSRAPAQPWAVVIFLHGIASHATWFSESADDLDERGIAVYALDRRGSGQSGGRRGHVRRYERVLEDVDQLMRLVASEHEGTPVFVAASSWAAKLGVVYAARQPTYLSGLMLLGPGLTPRVNLSLLRRVAVILGHVLVPTARIAIPLTPELYTANPPYLEYVRSDPLRLLDATTRFFWETARLDRHRDPASLGLGLPLLVLQGEADAMMDVSKTRRWFDQLALEDKTYRAYPGAGHTLDFEPDRGRYVGDIVTWLAARVPPPGARAETES